MIQFSILEYAGIDFPFSVNKGVHAVPFPVHTHDYTELMIVTDGSASHIVEGKAYNIQRGDVVVMMPSFSHELQNVQNLEHYNLRFDLEKLLLLKTDVEKLLGFQQLFVIYPFSRCNNEYSSRLTLDDMQLEKVEMLCDLMCSEWNERKDGYKWVIKSYFLALITYLARIFSPNVTGYSPKMPEILDTAYYMQENSSREITVPMLSKLACLSPRQYSRVFREVYGVPPNEYLMNIRMSQACRIMRSTNKSIAEVCLACGFSDRVSFARMFKNRYHVTPGKYRKI